jgi:hypothetical protein
MKFSNLLPDLPFYQPSLQDQFQKQHERFVAAFPGWSIQSTRRKIIANYWFEIILNNYFKLLVPGSILVLLFSKIPIAILVSGLASGGLLLFFALFFSLYLPFYHIEFLPRLDTCVEVYKGSQLEGIQECKKQQYSVVSLMLIHHVLTEMAGLEKPLINTASAQLLARQYGVSVKSISPALQLILQGDWNRKSTRKRTEILDDFETAKEHFRQLSETRAVQLLEKLQNRILQ